MVVKTTKLNLGAAASGLALCLVCSMVSASPSEQEIFAVQNALYGAGYSIDHADGKMDASTHKALREYQQKYNLKASGDIDDQTLVNLGVKVNGRTTANDQVQATLASYGIGSAPAGMKAVSQQSQPSTEQATAAKPEKKPAAKKQKEKPEKKKKKDSGWWPW